MKRMIRNSVKAADRIKPLEGVGTVLLAILTMLIVLWVAMIAVRFFVGLS